MCSRNVLLGFAVVTVAWDVVLSARTDDSVRFVVPDAWTGETSMEVLSRVIGGAKETSTVLVVIGELEALCVVSSLSWTSIVAEVFSIGRVT